MKAPLRYRRRIRRRSRLKEMATLWLLNAVRMDFAHNKTMVAIVGDHISDSIRAEGLYERRFLDVLKGSVLDLDACRAKVAIDVGANIGNHTLFLADIFSKVIAFEPNPLARSLLQINLELNGANNVEVRSTGLSDRPGRIILEYDHQNLGAAKSAQTGSEERGLYRSREVELSVGDQVIDRSAPVGFIKVDVEGAEEAVLDGLEQTIRTHRPIIMLEQLEGAIDERTGSSPAFSYLIGFGYRPFEIRRSSAMRRGAASVVSLILGRITYVASPVVHLEKRDYYCLLFLPADPPR